MQRPSAYSPIFNPALGKGSRRTGSAGPSYGANVFAQPTFAGTAGLEFDSNDPPVIAGNTLTFQGSEAPPVYCRNAATSPPGAYRYDVTVNDPGIGSTVIAYWIGTNAQTLFTIPPTGTFPRTLFGTVTIPGVTARKIGLADGLDRGATALSFFTFRPVL